MLRVPRRSFDLAAAKPHLTTDALKAWATKDHVIFDFNPERDEPGEWNYWEVFGEGDEYGDDDYEDDDEEYAGDYEGGGGGSSLASLLPLREDLMAGDLRALYLGWLAGVDPETDDAATEPPVPPGLQKLSGPLSTLVDLLGLDFNLLEVAAGGSGTLTKSEPAPADFEKWVAGMPTKKKDSIVVQLVKGDSPAALAAELSRQFRDSRPKARIPSGGNRRTVAELFAARDRLAEEKAKRKAKELAEAADRRAREAAARREKHLESLVGREDALWDEVEAAVSAKKPKEYDRAIGILRDLRDLAERGGRADRVAERVKQLRERHAKKPAFLERLDKAGWRA